MQQLGAWIVSQTAMAMISGVLLSLLKNGPVRSLLRLVCGILLILTALGPIHQISIPDWQFFAFDYGFEGETAAAMGQEFAREKRGRIISQQLEAYILDKAASLGAQISVELQLDGDGVPSSVELCGTWTPEIQQTLSEFLAEELGITKEDQQWTGVNGRKPSPQS